MPSLTYAELAKALKITAASANKLARRKRWPRVPGNDGKARVSVPEDALVRRDVPPDSPPPSPLDVPPVSPPDNQVHALLVLVARLEGELAGKAEALSHASARADAAEARADAADARLERQGAQHAADLAAELARTDKAFTALSALAEQLDVLAAERAKPWWRRLAG
jgi:hypothetical protein